MTEHYWHTDSASTTPPTWQQIPRATPPPLGRPGPPPASAVQAQPAPPPASAVQAQPAPPPASAAQVQPAPPVPGTPQQGAAPKAPTPRSRRRIRPLLGRWRLPLAAVTPCLLLAGIGWWLWPSQPGPVPLHLVAGTVHAALLAPDEASRTTGITLTSGPRASKPAPALPADPASCLIAVGPTSQAVFGSDWTAFLSATYQGAGGLGDYTMTQVIGVYPDSDKAGGVLRTLVGGLHACSSAVRNAQDGRSSKWTYRIDSTTGDSIAWTATQDGGNGWSCYRQAQLKGRSLLQVGICEAGDGRPTVRALTQLIAAKVSG